MADLADDVRTDYAKMSGDAKRPRTSEDKENYGVSNADPCNAVPTDHKVHEIQPMIHIFPEHMNINDLRTVLRTHPSAAPRVPQLVERRGEIVENGTLGDWRLHDKVFCCESNFCLHDKRPYIDELAGLHPLERDRRIVFDEPSHTYSIDGIPAPWSVTSFLSIFAHGFDPQSAVRTMMESPTWHERHAELIATNGEPMKEEQIIETWRVNGETQSKRGTLMHWHIELYLNGYDLAEPQSPEFLQFLVFKHSFMDALRLMPIRTELTMFHCALCIAGQADLVCLDANGDAVIIDWKRSGRINFYGFRGQMLHAPLEHLADCNWTKFCLQLNTYAYILETEYSLRVAAMYIAVFHPKQLGVPRVYVVPRMEKEIQNLVEHASTVYGTRFQSQPGDATPFDLTGFRFDNRTDQQA